MRLATIQPAAPAGLTNAKAAPREWDGLEDSLGSGLSGGEPQRRSALCSAVSSDTGSWILSWPRCQ
jgi:hypothetical protein